MLSIKSLLNRDVNWPCCQNGHIQAPKVHVNGEWYIAGNDLLVNVRIINIFVNV